MPTFGRLIGLRRKTTRSYLLSKEELATYVGDDLPLEPFFISIMNMADMLGGFSVDIATPDSSGDSRITIRLNDSPTTYEILLR